MTLRDGEKRRIPKRHWDLPFEVIAHRVDSETPYVILRKPDGTGEESLTDAEAQELIYRLQRALSRLPSSK